MNISVCTTVFNEEETIAALLDSLLKQSKKADEIVIVDGGSTDKTIEIIRHYQKKFSGIKLLTEKVSRAKGRNLGIELARNDIVAITDAGCVADKDWLKNITKPFETGRVDVVAGFYKMAGKTTFQKAASVYLGITASKFNSHFLPSTRSIAFTKKIWEAVGGFSENVADTAEDTIFNKKLIDNKAKISRVKDAIVEWGMPNTLSDFNFKIFNYSKGDAKSKILVFPGKGLMSHNIKVILVFIRYILGLSLFILGLSYTPLLAYPIILLICYLIWAYRKVFLEFGDWKTSLWGPVLQISSDFAVMRGFISGIIG